MDVPIKREICILLCHYLKQKNPEIYQKFAEFVEKQKLLPPGCRSVNEALNLRYESFSHDQFYEFIKSLRPEDDFPSIFRRIAPFEPPPVKPEEMAPIKRVYGHKKDIYCLEIDKLSRIIVTASDDCTIKVWAVPSINPIHTFIGHEGVVTNISMNPMCSMLLSSSEDKTLCLWSLESGKRLAVLGGFTSEIIHYAVFSPTGSMIAAACEDGTIPLWTTADALNSRPPIRILRSPAKGGVGWITFSPGSEFIAYSAEPNSVVVTALKTLNQTSLELHQSLADRIQFSTRYTSIGGELGPRLLTVSYEEGIAAIWCIDNGQWKKPKFVFRQHSGQGRRSSKINRVAWDCEEHLLVIAKTNAIFVVDSINGQTICQITSTAAAFENTTCVLGNPVKRELFFFANRSGACCLVDIFQPNNVVCEFRVADDADFTDAVWDKNGEYVYAIDIAGAITVFKLCESKNNVQMVVSDCILSNDGPFYVDRQGKRLERQPLSHDIRTYDIPLRFAQSLALRNSAIELKLIQRMISNERSTISQSQSTSIGPPPLHIRLSTEYPVNPRGKGSFKVVVESEESGEEEDVDVHIASDTDDWTFIEKDQLNLDDDEDNKKPPTFLMTKSIKKGYWPDWSLAISYDEAFFIPQFGDSLIFFKQPYLELLESLGLEVPDFIDTIFNSQPQQQQTQNNSDEEHANPASNTTVVAGFTPYMKRVAIKSIEPEGKDMILTISTSETNHFKIFFPFPEKKKFLIPLQRFKFALNIMNRVKVGSNITYESRDDTGIIVQSSGVVTSINEEWKINIYNSIELKVGNENIFVSPWDVVKIDSEVIPYHDISLLLSAISPRIIKSLEPYFSDPTYSCVINCPDPSLDSSVLQKIQLPMSLILIKERLEGNWYRAFHGIKYDAMLLQKNIVALYTEDSSENKIASNCFKNFFETLDSWTKKMIEQSRERQSMANRQQNK